MNSNVFSADSIAVVPFSALLTETVATGSAKTPSPLQRHRNQVEQEYREANENGYRDGVQKGYEEGYALGQERGYADGLAEAEQTMAEERAKFFTNLRHELEHVTDLVHAALETYFEKAEGEMETLIRGIAREVIGQELKTDSSAVVAMIRRALAEVALSSHARIRINPFDRPALEAAKAEILAASASLRSLEIVDDPRILGGCTIDTEGGVIDATVEGAFQRFDDAEEAA